jgi:hypothetical protein
MEIKLFTIARSVQAYPDGTYSILNGGIHEIGSPTFPAMLPITVFIHAETDLKKDIGTHHFSISVRNQDGQIVEVPVAPGKKGPIRIEGNIRIEKKPDAQVVEGKPDLFNVATAINFLAETPGNFSIWLEINGQSKQLPLKVTQLVQG